MEKRQDNVGFLVSDVARMMRRVFQKRLEGHSLTLAQSRVLIYASQMEGIRQVDLAEQLEIQPITLARLIDQLANAGLVERRPDPADRRAYHIYLTKPGSVQVAVIKRIVAGLHEEVLSGFSKQEASTLIQALKEIHAILSTQ